MANTIKFKRGSGSDPSASDLVVGELAVRTDEGKLFTKKDDGTVAEISGGGIDDGDKGDITVSNSGATFTIDSGVIDNANVASNAAIDGSKINPDFGSQNLVIADKIIHSGDTNTAIRFAGNDQFSVETGGTQRFTITDSQIQHSLNTQIAGTLTMAHTNGDFIVNNAAGTNSFTVNSSSGNVTSTGNLTLSNQGALRLSEGISNGSNYIELKAPSALSDNYTFTFPNTNPNNLGSGGGLLRTSTSGQLSWDTTNFLESGESINITSGSTFINFGQGNKIKFDSDNSNTYEITFVAPNTLTKDSDFTLPEDGSSGQFLTTNGSGALSFATVTNVTGSSASCTGNSATATKLATARTIAGVSFDGSANISLNNNAITNGAGYITSADGGNAATLDGIDSTSFVRSDADDTLNGQYTISDSANEKLVLAGSTSPYIRFQEGTTNKAYIQWNSDGYINLVNSESGEAVRIQSGASGLKFVEGGNVRNVYHTGNLSEGDGGLTTNNFTDADHSKLNGIEAGATADMSASEILTLIKTVDGAGSGLDADTLDSISSGSFLRSDANDTFTGTLTAGQNGKIAFPDNTTIPDNPTNQQHDYITFGNNGSISQISGRVGLMITSSDDSLVLANGDVGRTFTNSNINVDPEDIYLLSDSDFYVKTDLQEGFGTEHTLKFDNTGDLTLGDGSGDTRLLIKKADNNVSDHIQFYNGTTRVGEIGCHDTTWLRINQITAKNIYTPRYIRADNGFFVDGTSKGINGSGNFIGGTIAGASDYGTLLRSNTSDTMTGNLTMDGNVILATGHVVQHHNTATRDKYRVWNSSTYVIGMDNAMSFGGLNDYAMTFQMNSDADRGFVFLDSSHTDSQGAMSLTTEGKMCLAHSLRVGYGESDTTTPGATYRLDVSGDVQADMVSITNGIIEVKNAIATSHSLTSNYNGFSVSPTINSGVTVTVPSGAVFAIV